MLQPQLFKSLLSAKRGKIERSGIHAWHPYYAGYSEAFVTSAINYLDLLSTKVILDPWYGSGTTGLVASRFSIPTVGCEINPVMNIFSSAKQARIIYEKKIIYEYLKKIKHKFFQKSTKIQKTDPLLDFMSVSLCSSVRNLYSIVNAEIYPEPADFQITKHLKICQVRMNPHKAFLIAALFIASRYLAGYRGGSNPTWVKQLSEKPEIAKEGFFSEYEEVICRMYRDLENASIPFNKNALHIPLLADSRYLPISDDSVDAVITSPPYLTRIDYVMSTKPEFLIIDNPNSLRKVRENTIGSPVIVNKNLEISDTWGFTCLKLLKNVTNHQSKAAKSYYLPNMLQYFSGIELSLKEIYRVSKSKAQCLVVVQSSYFKELHIDLGQIYMELADNIGFSSKLANREVVRSHMAHVNTKSNRYLGGKVYYEDVVHLVK